MILRLSRFVHLLPVGEARVLVIHAVSHLRLVADPELGADDRLLRHPPGSCQPARAGVRRPDRARHPHRQDPGRGNGRRRRRTGTFTMGATPPSCWSATAARPGRAANPLGGRRRALVPADVAERATRLDLVLLGDCDVHMEADFLRREAGGRNIDLRVAAAFPDDLAFAGERQHDAILIGALRSRHAIAEARSRGPSPHAPFIAEAAERS